MQSKAYLRSVGKTRLGKTPKAVKLSRSPYDEDYYGLPVANPYQPIVDRTEQVYDRTKTAVEPIIWYDNDLDKMTGTIPTTARTAKDAIKDGIETVSDGLDAISWFLPDRSDLPESTVTRGTHHDHVTLLPAPKREQSINMFRAIEENPSQVIGHLEDPSEINWTAENAAIITALEAAAVLPRNLGGLPDYYGGDIEGMANGEYEADERKPRPQRLWQGMTYQEVALRLVGGGGTFTKSNKPIIGLFSQNTPTFLWPWTTEDGERYTAVDFAEMPFAEGKVGRTLKAPFEIVMRRQYNKVGDLPAYGAWGDIALGIPTILLVIGGVTFGGPVVAKAGKDALGIAKTAATIPVKAAVSLAQIPVDLAAKIQEKIQNFNTPRMIYKEGKYTPATMEVKIPAAHKLKMFIKNNKKKVVGGSIGFLILSAAGIFANRKFGYTQTATNFVADQKYQASNTKYIPTYHPEYNNWNANRSVPNQRNR